MVSNNPMFNKNYVNNPSMQAGIDAQSVSEAVDNSYLANRAKASGDTDPAASLGFTLGSWYLLNRGMDLFDKKSAGAYDKSLLGKLGNFGDKIAESAVAKPFVWVGNKIKGGWNWLAGKNKVAYALKNHHTDAEWKFAKTGGNGLDGYMSGDLHTLFDDNFIHPAKSAQQLERLGVPQSEIDAVKNSLKGLSKNQKAERLLREELKALGNSQASIDALFSSGGMDALKNLSREQKILKLGFRDVAEFEALMKDPLANMKQIQNALSRADKNIMFTYASRGTSKLSKFVYHLFGRKVPVQQVSNRLAVILKNGNRTGLGRTLAKASAFFLEGTTNRVAGGKLGVFMQAFIIGDMLANTVKAEKGDKFKTFMERFVNDFSYFLALPLGYKLMHKIGGLKYLGLSETEVSAFRTRLEKLVADKKAGVYRGNKAGFNAERKAIKDMLKGGVKGPRKLLKLLGRFVNIGNEVIPTYNMSGLRKVMKNIVGVPMRIAFPLFVVSPFVAKIITKGEHKIFGKPKHSVLDDESKEAENFTGNSQDASGQPIKHASDSNLMNMRERGENYQSPSAQTHKDTYNNPYAQAGAASAGASQADTVAEAQYDANGRLIEPKRTYIPSSDGVKYSQNNDKLNDALARADMAEKMAMDTLSMKF